MTRRTFTKKQIKMLEANKHVLKCTSKQVVFTYEFRLHALNRYNEGLTPSRIFKEAGLDVDLIDRHKADACVTRWRKQLKEHGQFRHDRNLKDRKPKEKMPKDEKERIEYLEAENAYLKAENAFLAKLRAKRRAEK